MTGSRYSRKLGLAFMASCFVDLLISPTPLTAQVTERVSLSSGGTEGIGGPLGVVSPSGNGRWVAFDSYASTLVPNDTNISVDVFVRDRLLGLTRRVSVSSSGSQASVGAASPSISADGRLVVFSSLSSNLVPNDSWGGSDVFVHDMETGTTDLVDVSTNGQQGDAGANSGVISANGRYVAFESGSRNLDPRLRGYGINIYVRDLLRDSTTLVSVNGLRTMGGLWPSISADGRRIAFESPVDLLAQDTNGLVDIYVKEIPSGRLFVASVDASGALANGASSRPSISGNGRYVAFESVATNLVPGDTNGVQDVFVHDLETGLTSRASLDSSSNPAFRPSRDPSVSHDGHQVVYSSHAATLVSGDTNDAEDVFVRDLVLGTTRRLSVDSNALEGNGRSYMPRISADGRYAAFHSDANNLVPNDTNGTGDTFVHGPLVALDGPALAWAGGTVTLSLWGGAPGDPALLALTAIHGRPVFLAVRSGPLDAQGRLVLTGPMPPTALGLDLTFQGMVLVSAKGAVESSGPLTVQVRLSHRPR